MTNTRLPSFNAHPPLPSSSAHVFIDKFPDGCCVGHLLSSATCDLLAADDMHHLSRVLRLRDGECVTASDGSEFSNLLALSPAIISRG